MIRAALTLALLLIAPLAARAQPITLQEARAMTVPELAQRVLGMVGTSIHEVRIDSDQAFWPSDQGNVLKTIFLAESPDSAGAPGLCAVRVFEVQFEPTGETRADGQIPVAVVRMFSGNWYRVVASLDYPGGRIDDSSFRERDRRICPGALPVLRPAHANPVPGYFTGNFGRRYELFPDEAWFIARALAAAQRWPGRIDCRRGGETPVPWLCGNPRAILASGFWGMGSYSLDYCEDQPATLCVTAIVHPGERYRQVTMTVATRATKVAGYDPVQVRGLVLEGYNGD